jgi:CMP-N-acetylneuraminic acid synthetase
MRNGRSILAVVPARSGSKGLPNKNMRLLAGKSLIAHAADTLAALRWLDRRIISTDSQDYAREAESHGLAAPFIRPAHLSTDSAGAIETLQHALTTVEEGDQRRYDIILVVEPTSPLRIAADIESAVDLLISTGADSAVTVSLIDTKFHPMKLLAIENERLNYYLPQGQSIKARQQLGGQYCFRNGLCYALTRDCLMSQQKIFTDNTRPLVINRPIANIDDATDFEWAEFLLSRAQRH